MRTGLQLSLGVMCAVLWTHPGARAIEAERRDPTGSATAFRTAGHAFFAQTNLSCFQVELGPAEYQQLSQSPKTYVAGKVSVDGRTFEQVGIRLKGTGTFQPISKRPNLALKFNWRRLEQDLDGLTKIFLNNSRQDPTLLCDFTASGIFADGGIPVPRITHARVQINGRDLGLCVVSEAVNKRFLKRHFTGAQGNLYEGAFRDIGARLEQDNGRAANPSPLIALRAAAALTNRSERGESLAKLLDLERFLDFVAIEMIVANWDGYAVHQNNYRVYEDVHSRQMTFIPHGLDNSLFESGLSLMPPRKSILVSALLDTPADRDAYRKRVARLLPKVFDPNRLAARLQATVAKLKQGGAPLEADAIERRAALLQQRIAERAAHLRAELAGEKPPTPAFDERGAARLEGWVAKSDWNFSPVEQLRIDGRSVLSVRATNGYCFGSWRLPAWLPSGRYRIEGSAASSNVNGLPSMTGSGAGVRVLGTMRGGGVDGSRDWTPVQHDFFVKEGCEWIEFIAELRAFTGSAMFDLEKLRVLRLEKTNK